MFGDVSVVLPFLFAVFNFEEDVGGEYDLSLEQASGGVSAFTLRELTERRSVGADERYSQVDLLLFERKGLSHALHQVLVG